MGVIVAVIRAVYRLPAKCVGYMGLVWAERRNNTTHTLPIARQLWVVYLLSGSSPVSVSFFYMCDCRRCTTGGALCGLRVNQARHTRRGIWEFTLKMWFIKKQFFSKATFKNCVVECSCGALQTYVHQCD